MKFRNRGLSAMSYSKLILAAVMLCGVVFLNSGAKAKRVGDVIRVGIWDGYKYIDNHSGKFSHCLMGGNSKAA